MSRNRASAKKAGTAWETEIVRRLIEEGWPHAERRRLAGAKDRGDIAGIAGVVIEAKNTARIDLAGAIEEARAEAINDGGSIGVAWIKRPKHTTAGNGYVVMTGATFIQLLKEAGY